MQPVMQEDGLQGWRPLLTAIKKEEGFWNDAKKGLLRSKLLQTSCGCETVMLGLMAQPVLLGV